VLAGNNKIRELQLKAPANTQKRLVQREKSDGGEEGNLIKFPKINFIK
jgi:hypothetical protein